MKYFFVVFALCFLGGEGEEGGLKGERGLKERVKTVNSGLFFYRKYGVWPQNNTKLHLPFSHTKICEVKWGKKRGGKGVDLKYTVYNSPLVTVHLGISDRLYRGWTPNHAVSHPLWFSEPDERWSLRIGT